MLVGNLCMFYSYSYIKDSRVFFQALVSSCFMSNLLGPTQAATIAHMSPIASNNPLCVAF